jgi:hypothetical protein
MVGQRLQSNAVSTARITTQTNAHPMLYVHWTEHQTGWSIKEFVRTARHYRSVHIRARRQTLTAADPLPEDLREVITAIHFAGPCAPIWPESSVRRAWRQPPRAAKPAPRVKRRVGEQVPDGSRACDTRVQVSARLAWVRDQLDRFAHAWDPQL